MGRFAIKGITFVAAVPGKCPRQRRKAWALVPLLPLLLISAAAPPVPSNTFEKYARAVSTQQTSPPRPVVSAATTR